MSTKNKNNAKTVETPVVETPVVETKLSRLEQLQQMINADGHLNLTIGIDPGQPCIVEALENRLLPAHRMNIPLFARIADSTMNKQRAGWEHIGKAPTVFELYTSYSNKGIIADKTTPVLERVTLTRDEFTRAVASMLECLSGLLKLAESATLPEGCPYTAESLSASIKGTVELYAIPETAKTITCFRVISGNTRHIVECMTFAGRESSAWVRVLDNVPSELDRLEIRQEENNPEGRTPPEESQLSQEFFEWVRVSRHYGKEMALHFFKGDQAANNQRRFWAVGTLNALFPQFRIAERLRKDYKESDGLVLARLSSKDYIDGKFSLLDQLALRALDYSRDKLNKIIREAASKALAPTPPELLKTEASDVAKLIDLARAEKGKDDRKVRLNETAATAVRSIVADPQAAPVLKNAIESLSRGDDMGLRVIVRDYSELIALATDYGLEPSVKLLKDAIASRDKS